MADEAPQPAAPAAPAEATTPNMSGKWQVYKTENFEDFLRENGANWMIRKMAANSKPTVEVFQEGDKFSVKVVTMFMTREESFTIGEEYEQAQHDGSKSKAIANWDGNKLVIKYEPAEGSTNKPQTTTREIVAGELVMTMEVGDVVAKRYMKKVEG